METFRDMNADGGFPAALVCVGLGIEEDALTDDDWNAWCDRYVPESGSTLTRSRDPGMDLFVSEGTDEEQR